MKKAKLGSRQAWFWLTLGLLIVLCVGIGIRRQERADRQAHLNRSLVDAVVNDRLGAVQSLLREGADPNARQQPDVPAPTSWEGIKAGLRRLWQRRPRKSQDVPPPALLLAVGGNDSQGSRGEGVVKALLNAGADPNLVIVSHSPNAVTVETPLNLAASLGETNMTQMLLDAGADVHAHGPDGETPLHQAIQQSDARHTLAITHLLLAHGADVNARNASNETPLIVAVTSLHSDPDVVRTLLDHGANVLVRGKDQETSLYRFLSRHPLGQVETVASFLAAGAGVDDEDAYGDTLLSLSTGDKKVFQLLLSRGAKTFTARDPQGENLIITACVKFPRDENDYTVIETLLAHGLSVNSKNRRGITPLLAATDSYVEEAEFNENPIDNHHHRLTNVWCFVDYLLRHGADVNAKDVYGQTALMDVSRALSPRATILLLARGADVNARDETGHTALMVAVEEGQIATARILLAHGADVTARDEKDHTALTLAWTNQFSPGWLLTRPTLKHDLIRLIEEYGATSRHGDNSGVADG